MQWQQLDTRARQEAVLLTCGYLDIYSYIYRIYADLSTLSLTYSLSLDI